MCKNGRAASQNTPTWLLTRVPKKVQPGTLSWKVRAIYSTVLAFILSFSPVLPTIDPNVLIGVLTAQATTLTWDGEANDGKWSNPINWTENRLPGEADIVTFDAINTDNVLVDISVPKIAGFDITDQYTGAIAVAPQTRITIGRHGFRQNGGTFAASDGVIDIYGSLNLLDGTFTAPANIMTVKDSLSVLTDRFNNHNGTIILNGVDQVIFGSATYYNLTKHAPVPQALLIQSGATIVTEGNLNLSGTTTGPLTIQATKPGEPAVLNPRGPTTTEHLALKDVINTSVDTITCANCTATGPTTGFNFTEESKLAPEAIDSPDDVLSAVDEVLAKGRQHLTDAVENATEAITTGTINPSPSPTPTPPPSLHTGCVKMGDGEEEGEGCLAVGAPEGIKDSTDFAADEPIAFAIDLTNQAELTIEPLVVEPAESDDLIGRVSEANSSDVSLRNREETLPAPTPDEFVTTHTSGVPTTDSPTYETNLSATIQGTATGNVLVQGGELVQSEESTANTPGPADDLIGSVTEGNSPDVSLEGANRPTPPTPTSDEFVDTHTSDVPSATPLNATFFSPEDLKDLKQLGPSGATESSPQAHAHPSVELSLLARFGVSFLAPLAQAAIENDGDSSEDAKPPLTISGEAPAADEVAATITDPDGNTLSTLPVVEQLHDKVAISLPDHDRTLRPGTYQLHVTLQRDGHTIHASQNFTWGVLAINFDQSSYRIGDTATIGIATLDDLGHTICDAELTLRITAPDGEVTTLQTSSADSFQFSNLKDQKNSNDQNSNNDEPFENADLKTLSENWNLKIENSPTCGPRTVTDHPDYTATFTPDQPGRYIVKLIATTNNGTRHTTDSFTVTSQPGFTLQRQGEEGSPMAATRLFPPADYTMKLTLTAHQDFAGTIIEQIPNSFSIKDISHDGVVVQPSATGGPTEEAEEAAGVSSGVSSADDSPDVGGRDVTGVGDGGPDATESLSNQAQPNTPQTEKDPQPSAEQEENTSENITPSTPDNPDQSAQPEENEEGGANSSPANDSDDTEEAGVPTSPATVTATTTLTPTDTLSGLDEASTTDLSSLLADVEQALEQAQGIENDEVNESDPQVAGDQTTTIQNPRPHPIIVWPNITLAAGESITLEYTYDPPDISPQFYLLGPLELHSEQESIEPNNQNFNNDVSATADSTSLDIGYWTLDIQDQALWSEPRSWHLAADATFNDGADGDWDIGTTWGGGCASDCDEGTDYPGPDDTTTIDSHTVTLSGTATNSHAVHDITLASGGTLNAGEQDLRVTGAWTNTGGNFTKGTSTVNFTSTATESLDSNNTSFHNLTINNGLVGYWPFDSGSGLSATDKSGYGNHGTLTNMDTGDWVAGTAYTQFTNPHALDFDGSNDYVSLPGSTIWDFTGDFTISAWVYTNVSASNRAIVGRWESSNSGILWYHEGCRFDYNNTQVMDSGNCITTGAWHHMTIRRSGSTINLFINGAQDATSGTLSGTLDNQSGVNVAIGMQQVGTTSGPWDGQIDDVRIYNHALAEQEINTLAAGSIAPTGTGKQVLTSTLDVSGDLLLNSGELDVSSANHGITLAGSWENNGALFTPRNGTVTHVGTSGVHEIQASGQPFDKLTLNDPSLVGYWKLDEGTGLTAKDASGNNNHGTLENGPTWSTTTSSTIAYHNPYSLDFDGVDDHVSLGDIGMSENSTFAVASWFKTNDAGTTQIEIFSEGQTDSATGFAMLRMNDGTAGKAEFIVEDDSGTSASASHSGGYNDGSWHHIVGIKRASNDWRLYVDGVERATSTTNLGALTNNTSNIGVLERTSKQFYFNGLLDDVRIYNRALSATEASDLASGSFSGPQLDLTSDLEVAETLTHYDLSLDTTGRNSNIYVTDLNQLSPALESRNATLTLTGTTTSNYNLQVDSQLNNFNLEVPDTDGLIGYWKFDEGQGTTANDSTAGANHGTLTNSPKWTTNTSTTISFANPYSLDFDGTNDYVDVGSVSLGISDTVTLSMWVKEPSSASGNYRTLFSSGGYVSGGYLLQRANTNALRLAYNGTDFWDGGTTTFDQWLHVAVTVEGGTPQGFYINGVETGPTRGSGSSLLALNEPKDTEIGRRTDTTNQYVDGLLDDVRIYDRALTELEVGELASGRYSPLAQQTDTRYTLSGSLNTSGNIALYSGELDVSTNNYDIKAARSWETNGGQFQPRSGTVYLTGTEDITTNLRTGSQPFNNLTLEDNSLVGYWKFDEGTGTVTSDSSGLNNTGTLQNSPTWNTTASSTITFTNPYSLEFDGSDDYVDIPTPSTGTGPFSVSFWINDTSFEGYQTQYGAGAVTNQTNDAVGQWWVSIKNDGAIYFYNYRSAGTDPTGKHLSTKKLSASTWHHVTATWDGDNNAIYIDGTASSFTDSSTLTGWGTHSDIGRHYTGASGYSLSATLDDIRIYNRALEPTEITQLAQGEQLGPHYELKDTLDINGTLTTRHNTIDVSTNNQAIKVADLDEYSASLYPRSGRIVLDGTANQTIQTASALNNLDVEDNTEDSLVGYWKFDEGQGTVARDSSGSANHGTLLPSNGLGPLWSTTTTTTTLFTNPHSLEFDGSDDYVQIPDPGTTPTTFSFWINPDTTNDDERIISNNDTSKAAVGNQFATRFNSDAIEIWSSSWQAVTSSTISTNVWTHVAIAIDSSNNATGYVNGNSELTANDSYELYQMGIGDNFHFSAGSAGDHFNGLIDDVRIYNKALTAGEVRNLADGRYANGDSSVATFTLNNDLDVNGNLSLYSGTLDVSATNCGGGAQATCPITVATNWNNYGGTSSFTPYSGTVTLDGSAQAINGSTTFYNLTKQDLINDTTDLTLTLDNTGTQRINGTLTLKGTDANDRVNLVSSVPTTTWGLNFQGAHDIDWLEVTDSNNSGATIYLSCSTNVTDGGNNTGWDFTTTKAFTQNDFRWYADSDSENVTDPWGNPDLSENTAITVVPATLQSPASGTEMRIRLNATAACGLAASAQAFKLQYAQGPDCTSGSLSWSDVGASGGGEIWRYASSSETDGADLTAAKLSTTDVTQEYIKSSPTGSNPVVIPGGADFEYDFHIENNGATTAATYCFRMVESDATVFGTYNADSFPKVETKPGTNNLLKHGNVFIDGSEKGFTWAD